MDGMLEPNGAEFLHPAVHDRMSIRVVRTGAILGQSASISLWHLPYKSKQLKTTTMTRG